MQNLINFYPISTKNSSLLNSNIGRNQDKKTAIPEEISVALVFFTGKEKRDE